MNALGGSPYAIDLREYKILHSNDAFIGPYIILSTGGSKKGILEFPKSSNNLWNLGREIRNILANSEP
jgi:hypothetical protein